MGRFPLGRGQTGGPEQGIDRQFGFARGDVLLAQFDQQIGTGS
jgi:hypothetical protein